MYSGIEDRYMREMLPGRVNGLRILDVGCGLGYWGWFFRTRGSPYLVGVDIQKHPVQSRLYDDFYNINVRNGLPFPDGSFELTVCSHLVEHLSKEDGLRLLDELKRVTYGLLVVNCPYGDTTKRVSNHISAWYPGDFERCGFEVEVVVAGVRSRVVGLFIRLWFGVRGRVVPGSIIALYNSRSKSSSESKDMRSVSVGDIMKM